MIRRYDRGEPSDDASEAFESALRLLAARDHCRRELEIKLLRRFTPEAASDAVDRCEKAGYVNDARTAEYYAESLAEKKKLGRRAIFDKLVSRGIDESVAQRAVDALDIDEREAAAELAAKLLPPDADEKDRARVFRRLLAKGYSRSAAIDALNRAASETEENE